MITHLRVVPGLWVAVEEQRRPEIRSRPVIMGGLPHQRGAVREANFPAQRCGVRVGMTLAQAHQHCPEGLFLIPDLPHYESVWEEICSVLRIYTPLVEPVEMGQAACDLSGCERRWKDSWSAAREIALQVRRCTGITPWLGVASNRFVAQIASTAIGADGITVVGPGQEATFLADLPITLLPDVDPRLALTFQVLGLRTMGQFAALPAAAVKRRFGTAGERLHSYARGIDPRPVVPPPARAAVTARYECEDGSYEEAVAAVQQLAATCAAELQRRHLAGRLITLRLIPPSPPGHPQGEPLHPPAGEGSNTSSDPSLFLSHTTLPLSRGRGYWTRWGGEGATGEGFPIPYRIHSMLPQPGSAPSLPAPMAEARPNPCSRTPRGCNTSGGQVPIMAPTPGQDGQGTQPEAAAQFHAYCSAPTRGATTEICPTQPYSPSPLEGEGRLGQGPQIAVGGVPHPEGPRSRRPPCGVRGRALTRTPIDTPAPLAERAQRLLQQHWPHPSSVGSGTSPTHCGGYPALGVIVDRPRLQAIELEVSEFEAPAQLSFAEFNRLDQTGRLAGLSAGRLQALLTQEEILAARYGDASFRHVVCVDPGNILTERRVRWQIGLGKSSVVSRRSSVTKGAHPDEHQHLPPPQTDD